MIIEKQWRNLILTARNANILRKERKVLELRYLFFASLAQPPCAFAFKNTFLPPPIHH
jgi:hypothetical protein